MITVLSDLPVNGRDPKYWVEYKGYRCLMKLPGKVVTAPYTEHLASSLIRALGVPCHKTEVIMYNDMPAVLCQDIVPYGYSLRAYEDSAEASMSPDSQFGFHYSFADILAMLPPESLVSFWDMIVCDCLVSNTDRHGGNWGFLEEDTDGSRVFSPLYDNANSFGTGRPVCAIRLHNESGYPALMDYSELCDKMIYDGFFTAALRLLGKDPVYAMRSLRRSVPEEVYIPAAFQLEQSVDKIKEVCDRWHTKTC